MNTEERCFLSTCYIPSYVLIHWQGDCVRRWSRLSATISDAQRHKALDEQVFGETIISTLIFVLGAHRRVHETSTAPQRFAESVKWLSDCSAK